MITIERMNSAYHLAGAPERRAQLSRRLDRIVTDGVSEALEGVAAQFGADDGPVLRIHRLDLNLWLNAATSHDGDIARTWAAALSRAMYQQMANGGDNVRRYRSRAAYLASWLIDLVAGRHEGRWEYSVFSALDGLRTGQAAAFVLANEPHLFVSVFAELREQGRAEPLIRTLRSSDVEAIWLAVAQSAPRPPRRLRLSDLEQALDAGVEREPSGDADARARNALRWLIDLSAGPIGLRPPLAAGVAMQASHLSALLAAIPQLRSTIRSGADPAALRNLLATAPADLAAAAAWLADADGVGSLVDVIDRFVGPVSETLASAYAGVGLLLPSLRSSGLTSRLPPEAILQLLAASVGRAHRPIAQSDPALRWLSGAADTDPRSPSAPIDWPPADELSLDPGDLETDADAFGSGPELPALRLLAHRFASGLRGMDRASLEYLAQQFFRRNGTISRTDTELTARIGSVPLGVLLQMGGRLGDQGPVEWLDGRRLIVEIGDV